MEADGFVSVTDNGRGIPVDPHPKFKNKSALEVIMCTLHAGGKFDSEVYETSGGLHGVGVSVANALSDRMEVEVARGQKLYKMAFERGKPKGKLQDAGKAPNRRGTKVRFHPDAEIFGPKAALQGRARVQDDALEGLSVRRRRDPLVVRQGTGRRHRRSGQGDVPFRGRAEGLSRRDAERRDAGASRHLHRPAPARSARMAARNGRSPGPPTPTASSTPTATPFRRRTAARTSRACAPRCLRGLKDHAERVGQGKRAAPITSDDVMVGAGCMLSVFIREPEFQGQTKDRLATAEAQRIVENAIKDPFDHWLAGNPHAGEQAPRLRRRPRRGAHPPPPGEGHFAQDRDAQAPPARQARRLHQRRGRGLGNLHRRGRQRRGGRRLRTAQAPAPCRR